MQSKEIIFVVYVINNCYFVISCLGFDFQIPSSLHLFRTKAYLTTTRRRISHAWVPLKALTTSQAFQYKKIFIVLFRRLSLLFRESCELYKQCVLFFFVVISCIKNYFFKKSFVTVISSLS
jgi:hypothetical protein